MQNRDEKIVQGLENTDLELLINYTDFFIYEHRYVEFKEQYIVFHRNRLRDNANVVYYIVEGGGWIEDEKGKTPIEAGKIYFHPCSRERDYCSVFLPGTKKVYFYFYFDLFSCNDIFSDFRGFRCMEDDCNLIERIKNIVLSESVAKQLMIPGLVMQSLLPLFEEIEDVLEERLLLGKRYQFLFDYLDRNLSHHLTLEQISNSTGISYSSLTHMIPDKLGFTVKQYIQKKIMKRICLDLEYTDMRVKDIAEKYGFTSEVYFSDWFFKQYHVRPRAYRKFFQSRKQEDYSLYFNRE